LRGGGKETTQKEDEPAKSVRGKGTPRKEKRKSGQIRVRRKKKEVEGGMAKIKER